jgi:hypothetical protein
MISPSTRQNSPSSASRKMEVPSSICNTYPPVPTGLKKRAPDRRRLYSLVPVARNHSPS